MDSQTNAGVMGAVTAAAPAPPPVDLLLAQLRRDRELIVNDPNPDSRVVYILVLNTNLVVRVKFFHDDGESTRFHSVWVNENTWAFANLDTVEWEDQARAVLSMIYAGRQLWRLTCGRSISSVSDYP